MTGQMSTGYSASAPGRVVGRSWACTAANEPTQSAKAARATSGRRIIRVSCFLVVEGCSHLTPRPRRQQRRPAGLDAGPAADTLWAMKSRTEYLTFNIPARMDFLNITDRVEQVVRDSGVKEGLVLVNAMHITASVFINDDESGLHHDYKQWLEQLAP